MNVGSEVATVPLNEWFGSEVLHIGLLAPPLPLREAIAE